MFWKLVARWISAVSIRGKLPNALDGSVLAPAALVYQKFTGSLAAKSAPLKL